MPWKALRDIAVMAAAGIFVGATAKYARIPGEVAVLESRIGIVEQRFDSFDRKLDTLLKLAQTK